MEAVSICMTATIVPNTVMVSRTDVSARLADYKKCISFYLEQTEAPLYFIENSDYDLSSDADFQKFEHDERFHLLRMQPHSNTSLGKGFQEFYLLDTFVKEHLKTPMMVKVTGRYIVENIAEILNKVDAPLCIDMHRKMKVAITGFFCVNKALYEECFEGMYAEANDEKGIFIEHVFYQKIQESASTYARLLPLNPKYVGVSGSYGQSLARNPYKMMVRSVERKCNRLLGIHQFLIEY